MKDKTFKVQYMRTDTGCLQIFVKKGKQFLANLTVFADNRIWLDVPEENTATVDVFPDNALHRVWYKEVCKACGWESEPFEGIPIGPGGTLNCPECKKANRNPTLEGCYGNVHGVRLDWKTKKPMEKEE